MKEAYKGKKVIITGGFGFIGSNIAKALLKLGAEVHVVDNLDLRCGGNEFNVDFIKKNARFHLHLGSMADEKLMKGILPGIDFIFNMAGHVSHIDSIKDPKRDIDLNLNSHVVFLELCRKYNPKVKIGYASTRGVYGKPGSNSINEECNINPVDFNGVNKYAAESYHLIYSRLFGIKSFVIRLTNTYGPGMRIKDSRQGFICLFFRQALNGEDIHIFGDGSQLRDFNYVDDVVNAFLKCMINPKTDSQVFNIGSEKSRSVLECAKLIISNAKSSKIIFKEFPNENKKIEIGDYKADYSKIRDMVGWNPSVKFEEGIKNTMGYYIKNNEHYI